MEIDPKEILKYVESQEQYKGETKAYWESIRKLPEYDYSKFYSTYAGYPNNILQGDGIGGLKFVNLPNEKISEGKGIILSNTCDIELENKKKFSARIIYAPIMLVSAYAATLKKAQYTDEQIKAHTDEIRKQKVSQIFYLPSGQYVPEEAIIFFDNLCTCDNMAVSRENLQDTKVFSLSAYGWHVFLVRLAHFFTKLSDESVELRFKSAAV